MAQGGSELVAWRRAMAHMRIAYTVSLVTHMSLLTDPELKLLTPPDTYRLRDINFYILYPLLCAMSCWGHVALRLSRLCQRFSFPLSPETSHNLRASKFFCESSLLRINQRHHSPRTRLWYTHVLSTCNAGKTGRSRGATTAPGTACCDVAALAAQGNTTQGARGRRDGASAVWLLRHELRMGYGNSRLEVRGGAIAVPKNAE